MAAASSLVRQVVDACHIGFQLGHRAGADQQGSDLRFAQQPGKGHLCQGLPPLFCLLVQCLEPDKQVGIQVFTVEKDTV